MDGRNTHSRGDAVFSVTCALLGASFLFVLLSTLSRACIVRKVAAYGWLLVLSWILGLGMSVAVCYATKYGLGLHQQQIPAEWMPVLGRASYVFSILYNPALMAQKSAILCLYLNIMSSNDICRWFTIATMVVVNVGGLTLTLLSAFRCHTLGAALNIASAPGVGKCISLLTIYLSSAPLNIATDIVILLIPMPLLASLRLPGSQKAAIIFIFSVGIFVAAVDVVRIAYLERASQSILQAVFQGSNTKYKDNSTDNFTWFASYSYMWSVVEVHVGIMCSCVPALKPLVQKVFSRGPHQVNDIVEDSQWLNDFHADPASPTEMTWQECLSPTSKGNLGSLHLEIKSPGPAVPSIHHKGQDPSAWTPRFENRMLSLATFASEPYMERVVSRSSTRKSLTELSTRQALGPGIAISVLFLIWGFEYGVLSVLNDVFQKAAHLTPGQLTALHSSYYIGYFVGPLTIGYPVLKRWDFKTCSVAGLAIYAFGTLVFWPAAVLNSFPVYFISNFIAGAGLSMVEVAADTLILLCGPDRFAEVRLCFSQGVQAVGTVVAPLILQQAFKDSSSPANTLVQTQWAYLGVAMIATLLAVIYFALPFAEDTDQGLTDVVREDNRPWDICATLPVPFIFGVLSIFCYVGAQEVNATSFMPFVTSYEPGWSSWSFLAIAHSAFAVSRFVAAFVGLWIKPKIMLFALATTAVIFQCLAAGAGLSNDTATSMLMAVFFVEGPIFPLLFGTTFRSRMRKRTRLSAAMITASISGGAVFAPISSAIQQGGLSTYRSSFFVAVAAFGLVWVFLGSDSVATVLRRRRKSQG